MTVYSGVGKPQHVLNVMLTCVPQISLLCEPKIRCWFQAQPRIAGVSLEHLLSYELHSCTNSPSLTRGRQILASEPSCNLLQSTSLCRTKQWAQTFQSVVIFKPQRAFNLLFICPYNDPATGLWSADIANLLWLLSLRTTRRLTTRLINSIKAWRDRWTNR